MAIIPSEFAAAYKEYDREFTLSKTRLGCWVGIVLVPLFSLLDYFIYKEKMLPFLVARLLCALAIAGMYLFLQTRIGRKHYRFQGIILLLIPAVTIAWMIYATKGVASSYYMGLNLVLMVVGVVLDWDFWQSLVSVLLVWGLYLAACWLSPVPADFGNHIDNLFFMVAIGVIIVAGAKFHSDVRKREFISRCEAEKSRQALEITNQRLIELDQIKSRFFANVSHELRTPLTLLLAPLESFAKKYRDKLDAPARDALQTMQANGMRLLKLINDLLELIRLESGRPLIKSEAIAMPEFVRGLASAVRQVAINKKIALDIDVDPQLETLLGDHDKLEKVVLNLLFNALKFTPAGGRIWLRAERQGEDYCLTVRDTGVGIAAKNLPHVFERFWQEDNSAKRKFQGVGIGLALVKELIEAQNGTVSVQSQEGKGSTFVIRLPYVKADPEAAPKAKTGAPPEEDPQDKWLAQLYRRAETFAALPAARRTEPEPPSFSPRRAALPLVLVADDEPDMRRFLRGQLEDEYEVIEAEDGLKAVNQARACQPDLMLLDLMMPYKDGLQVCAELRENKVTADLPIILLTARANEEDKFEALRIGANDFLAKPFSSVELAARVKNLIGRRRTERRLSKQNEELSHAIDQIRETELQLVQSEKLSSLGRLSAGIIHEINNPLHYSLTSLFALKNKGKNIPPELQPEFNAIIGDVEEGIKRVHNIVSDLRTFTHPGSGEGELVEVASAVAAALRFLAGEWKNRVTIHQDIPPGQTLWANRNKLIHILVNLLQNAIDALGEKTFAHDETPQIQITGWVAGDRSLVLVRDNGPGLAPQAVGKIFDPFFTTKEPGKGMGLGLSICFRIAQSYGGKISVRSEPEHLCEFTLDFPARAGEAAPVTSGHESAAARI